MSYFELDVTHMVTDADWMPYLSGSVAELGDRAGALTWENSQNYAAKAPLLSNDRLDDAREYFACMGFGDDARQWSDAETQAAMIQDVASAIREMEAYEDYASYEVASEKGQVSGQLYKTDTNQWYFSVSS